MDRFPIEASSADPQKHSKLSSRQAMGVHAVSDPRLRDAAGA